MENARKCLQCGKVLTSRQPVSCSRACTKILKDKADRKAVPASRIKRMCQQFKRDSPRAMVGDGVREYEIPEVRFLMPDRFSE